MNKIILATLLLGTISAYAQKSETFSKLFAKDKAFDVTQRAGGGFVIVGRSESFTRDLLHLGDG